MVLEDFFPRHSAVQRFRLPPLGSETDGFCEWLCGQGYSRYVLRRHVWKVSSFNQYLRRRHVTDFQQVERSLAEQFISNDLLRFRRGECSKSSHAATSGAVHSFLYYLSVRGILVACQDTPLPYQELLDEFLDYLESKCNLTETSVKRHCRSLTPFLEDLGADAAPERLHKLSAQRIQKLFAKYTQQKSHSTRRAIQGALRKFLRFCRQKGYTQRDLAQAVSPIRTYKLSGVPRGVSEEDARKVLGSIDRTPIGLRDNAIIQLLYTYGVRGGQVRALALGDIRWRQNQIRFRALKGGKQVVQPLTDEVGESLLEYLRHGRPKATCPEVFLTARAPFGPLRDSSIVSLIIANRMRKAGVNGSPKGSHAFRHAFATRMLKGGQSLKTIADMLGHRLINTTFIYTKVDLETLKQLPLQWPEV